MGLLVQFSFQLLSGMCVVLAAMPKATVASGFFRTQLQIVLGMATVAALAAGSSQQVSAGPLGNTAATTIIATLAALAFVGAALWTLERRVGGERCLWMLAVGTVAFLGLHVSTLPAFQGAGIGVLLASEFSSALTLGTAMCGMLLGHSYLTSPTMSLLPLARLNHWLLAATILRGMVSGICLALAPETLRLSPLMVWLSLRWIAGVIGPVIMAVMVVRILRYRNTQAATGVLFVAVILTFLGELTASLLLSSTGWPL